MPGVPYPDAGLTDAAPGIVIIPGNLAIDIVDAEREGRKQLLHRLLGQHAEFIVKVQPEAFLCLSAILADCILIREIPVVWASIEVHPGYHQYPRIGQCFDYFASHGRLDNEHWRTVDGGAGQAAQLPTLVRKYFRRAASGLGIVEFT